MQRFVVIDKQEGFSWINHSIDEVVSSVGYEGEEWGVVKDKIKGVYEVIEINGTFDYKYILD